MGFFNLRLVFNINSNNFILMNNFFLVDNFFYWFWLRNGDFWLNFINSQLFQLIAKIIGLAIGLDAGFISRFQLDIRVK